MTKDEFKKMPLNGAFLFYSDLCKQCEAVKTELLKRLPEINCVLCDEDPDFFWKIHNVDLIPCVRYYDNGVMVFEKLYKMDDSDYAKLLEFCSK